MHPNSVSMQRIKSPIVSRYVQKIKRYSELGAAEKLDELWGELGSTLLTWFVPFKTVLSGNFSTGNVQWFCDGFLNVCYNCVDRHAIQNPEKVALMYEGDEMGSFQEISFGQLLENVCKLANVLKDAGFKKGDVGTIFMPTAASSVYAMLACARLGIVHNVVFGGFSAESLAQRIIDSKSKFVFTVNESMRGGKAIKLKQIVDDALMQCTDAGFDVCKVFVFEHRKDTACNMREGRDVWVEKVMPKQPAYCPCEMMNSEDPLFVIYTSGSTGKPKGLVHSSGGYLTYASATQKYIFDFEPSTDRFGCAADIGWITGHTYVVYGPLANGGSTLLFDSVPTYPTPSRYWNTVDKLGITHLYTAPTIVRMLKKFGTQPLEGYSLNSLRVLGSVGEPINDEAWSWFYKYVGREKCHLVDTYWQSETGGILISGFAGVSDMIPSYSECSFFGHSLEIVHNEDLSEGGKLVMKRPWPGMAKTILNNHEFFVKNYFAECHAYLTGDAAILSKENGFIRILGRIDDVINVAGHRLSTAEIESAICRDGDCVEAAVIGKPDPISGFCIAAFAVKQTSDSSLTVTEETVRLSVRKHIGPIAVPKHVVFVSELPKTRSGKIVRRLLRSIVSGTPLGDLSTVNNPQCVDEISKIRLE